MNFENYLEKLQASAHDDGYYGLSKFIFSESSPFTNHDHRMDISKYKTPEKSDLAVDTCTLNILKRFEKKLSHIPVDVTGDGNCFFNAMSIALSGGETLAVELRVRTCIEMVKFQQYYETHALSERFSLVSPEYVDACLKCAQNYEFSSIYTIHALASVLCCTISSVYPCLNGLLDNRMNILNATLPPRSKPKQFTNAKFYICWTTGSTRDIHYGKWDPNHFVPLIPMSQFHEDQLKGK